MNIGIAVSNNDWRKQPVWKRLRAALAIAGHRVNIVAPDGKWDVFPADVGLVITNDPRIAKANISPGRTVTGPDVATVLALADGREVPVPDDGEGATPPDDNGEPGATTSDTPPDATTNASKAAVALAAVNSIDLFTVTGTGKDGQITKPDVAAAIAAQTPPTP